MKPIFTLLLLFFGLTAYGQTEFVDDSNRPSKKPTKEQRIKEMQYESAGWHLRRSGVCSYASLGLSVASVIPLCLPAFDKVAKDRSMNYITSGALTVGSLICYIAAARHIQLAGKKLELQSRQNEIGLVLKF